MTRRDGDKGSGWRSIEVETEADKERGRLGDWETGRRKDKENVK